MVILFWGLKQMGAVVWDHFWGHFPMVFGPLLRVLGNMFILVLGLKQMVAIVSFAIPRYLIKQKTIIDYAPFPNTWKHLLLTVFN